MHQVGSLALKCAKLILTSAKAGLMVISEFFF
ncbi:hypothetical protein LAF9269_01079 [Limosilactobacillus fermentum]|nr:hypothetical protein LAF9269_01079 [Limosilactobacillus fermentum]